MKMLLSGNEAVARGAWEGGVIVSAAYPGTPSTEILENLAKYEEVRAEWSPNEKVAFEVALGAAIGGARATVSMKHVGLNVAADPLMSSAYSGINAGFLIISADDPGMHSSQNEQDNRILAKFAKIPVLEPSDSQEAHDFAKIGFWISEEFDTPILLRLTTRISHTKCIVEVGEREEKGVKPYNKDIYKYILVPAHARKRHIVVEERLERLREFAEKTELNRIEWGNRDIGIVTSGIAYQYAKEIMPEASFLKLGFSWPTPIDLIKKFSSQVKKLYVVEELEPFIEDALRAAGLEVTGKEVVPRINELTPRRVRVALTGKELPHPEPEEVVSRPPVLCPGCPHMGIYWALRRLRATVMGDIGCYTLGFQEPLSAMDTCLEMGFSVSGAHGLEKAQGRKFAKKLVATIGDSTFLHSGVTGLMDVVYNKGTSTVIILDNRTTAMTGHQDHPATGKTAKGEPTKEIDFKKLAHAIGVEKVFEIDPHNLKMTRKVLKEAMELDEPTVVIAKRPCVLLKEEWKKLQARPKKKIIPEKCKGETCRNCFTIGCSAIYWKDGKAWINPLLCVGCDLCQQLCPFGAIVEDVKDEN